MSQLVSGSAAVQVQASLLLQALCSVPVPHRGAPAFQLKEGLLDLRERVVGSST